MAEKLNYTLAEVAEMTGFPLESLQRDAWDGRIEHIHRGRKRLMTMAQIEKLLERCTVKVTNPAKPRTAAAALEAADRDRRRVAAMQRKQKAA